MDINNSFCISPLATSAFFEPVHIFVGKQGSAKGQWVGKNRTGVILSRKDVRSAVQSKTKLIEFCNLTYSFSSVEGPLKDVSHSFFYKIVDLRKNLKP